MTIVVFDYAQWSASYPSVAALPGMNADVAAGYFDLASLYCNNTDGSIVAYDPTATPPVTTRRTLLYLLVAHIAEMANGPRAGSGLVGPLTQATQGTVNVTTSIVVLPAAAAWYAQTQYGLQFWAATARYRRMRYLPGPQRYAQSTYGCSPWRR